MDIFIDEVKETVNIKVAKDTRGKIIRVKPEYDDLKKIADRTKKPLREISELVNMKAKEVFVKKGIL